MIAEVNRLLCFGFYGTLHCVELQRLEIVGYAKPLPCYCGGARPKKLEELLAAAASTPGRCRTDWLLTFGKRNRRS